MNEKLELWYEQPAAAWEETLPVGNGRLGAMVWGGTDCALFGLNEDGLWSGYKRDKNNPEALQFLPEVRRLLFEGQYAAAEKLATEHCLAEYTESYLPLGNLRVKFAGVAPFSQSERPAAYRRAYRRSLCLEDALSSVEFSAENRKFVQQAVASYPDNAIYFLFKCDKPFDCEISFESQLKHKCVASDGAGSADAADKARLAVQGQCPEHVDPSYVGDNAEPIIQGTRGLFFRTDFDVIACDGKIRANTEDSAESGESKTALAVTGASVLIIRFRSASGEKPIAELPPLPAQAGASTFAATQSEADLLWNAILARHNADYAPLFNACRLNLGEQLPLATDKRLERLKAGEADPALYALYFAYSRYLLIASSRAGSQPANLQGIWSWELRAPWSSNFTTNINTQMNYWPVESCALAPCFEPYIGFMRDVARNGRETARIHYGCRGFVAHHNVDFWRCTNPMGVVYGQKSGNLGCATWGLWPMGGAWLCQQLFRHYEYSRDASFLQSDLYPILKSCAQFLNDFLVEHDGLWGTCPSTSPENNFFAPETNPPQRTAVARNSAMDLALVRELAANFAQTLDELKSTGGWQHLDEADRAESEALLAEFSAKIEKLEPFKIGSHGQLLEWNEEFAECEPGHRHISHLYGLFPSELFENDDALKNAARKSLEIRLANGGGHTGWSCAWIINVFAILGDAENAWKFLEMLLCRSTYPNLWDAHPPFQIDGNFGGAAAIANMLVQDRGGAVKLLPALPAAFKNGSVTGLRIKNRKAVDIAWEDGKVTESRIYSVE